MIVRQVKVVFKILLLLLAIYFLLRVCFYQIYYSTSGLSFHELLIAFYWGTRLDFTTIFLLNGVLCLYLLFLYDKVNVWLRKKIAVTLFVLFNFPMLALCFIDLAYYHFNLRRSNVDILYVFKDSYKAWGLFLIRYWYLLIFFILIIWLSLYVFLRILNYQPAAKSHGINKSKFKPAWQGITFLLITFLIARGTGVSPILPSTPLLYLSPQNESLANNSAITFLYSLTKKQTVLADKNYFSNRELDSLFTIRRQYNHADSFSGKNVVIFILESFRRGFLEEGNPQKASTPFLDSLMNESIICKNAYASGVTSNKGIVALLAGIPPVLDEPYYYSVYSNNAVRGMGTILKEKGYSTNFFMGAGKDHFGFGKLCHIVGIDNYYSEDDYGNPEHSDGEWGIYDHYFLPYAADVLNKKQTPFLAVLFNISSHDPFTIPDSLRNKFSIAGQGKQRNAISYVDYALRLFFEQAKNSTWYKNTIFVFASDHYYDEKLKVFRKPLMYKVFQVPMFFHIPYSGISQQISHPVQQMDLVPSVMDMLHYNKPFMSFGRSIYDSACGKVFNKINDNYQYLDSSTLIGFNPGLDKFMYYYNYVSDTALEHDLLQSDTFHVSAASQAKMNYLKAMTQRFNNSLIHNKLLVK